MEEKKYSIVGKVEIGTDEYRDLKNELKQASKETADKILQLAYDRCLEKSFIKKVEELAKELGCEIKE